jgi:hypothetical protein
LFFIFSCYLFLKKWYKKFGPEIALGSISPAIAAKYRDAKLQEVSAYPVRAELALLSHLFTKAKKKNGGYRSTILLLNLNDPHHPEEEPVF